MIEAIYFRYSDKNDDTAVRRGRLDIPLPRVGDSVDVRDFHSGCYGAEPRDISMKGVVDSVHWYYSSGNAGLPVVDVYLRKEKTINDE